MRAKGHVLEAEGTPPRGPVQVFIRPHRIRLGGEGQIPARVATRTYEGATALVSLDTSLGLLQAEVPADLGLREGDTLFATLPPAALRVFPA